MKKSIIKRRKRVVPALRDQSPTAATQSSNDSSASPEASPAALSQLHDEHYRYMSNEPADPYHPMHGRGLHDEASQNLPFAPPPVDFTTYHKALPTNHQLPKLLEPERVGHSPISQYGRRSASPNTLNIPKKRTLAESASEGLLPPTALETGSMQLPPIISSANHSPPERLSSISAILGHTDTRDASRIDPAHAGRPPLPQVQALPSLASFSDERDRRAQLEREAEQMREALRAKERELAQIGR